MSRSTVDWQNNIQIETQNFVCLVLSSWIVVNALLCYPLNLLPIKVIKFDYK